MATTVILLQIFLCLLIAFDGIDGSVINIQTSHTNLKPLLTTNLTLRCSLRDSSPSSSIIGKRSVDGLTSAGNPTGQNQQDDVIKTTGQTKRSVVTQTDGNVKFGLSISLKRDGIDLATINEHVPATAAPGLTGYEVTGQLNNGGNSGETGYLELHWSHPSLSEAGSYNCEISALDTANHIVNFGKSLEINAGDVTVPDLVKSVHNLIVDSENKDEIIAQLRENMADQNQTIAKQDETITKLSEELKKLDQDFNALKSVARTEPDIYFTAGLSRSKNFATNQPIIYDHVYTNVGAGYNNVTGYFIAPLTGYYKFDIYVLARAQDESDVILQVNGVDTVATLCWANDSPDVPSSANSLITHLVKGDKVNAIARRYQAQLYVHIANQPTNSFTGQLLSIA